MAERCLPMLAARLSFVDEKAKQSAFRRAEGIGIHFLPGISTAPCQR
jgi:hypothetical protein